MLVLCVPEVSENKAGEMNHQMTILNVYHNTSKSPLASHKLYKRVASIRPLTQGGEVTGLQLRLAKAQTVHASRHMSTLSAYLTHQPS